MKSRGILVILTIILLLIIFIIIRLKFIRGVWLRLFSIVEKGDNGIIDNYQVAKKYNADKKKGIIISCSIFGNFNNGIKGKKLLQKYFSPLITDGKNVVKTLKDSNVRVYVEPTLSPELLQQLIDLEYEVYVMDKPSKKLGGTFWRFLALQDKEKSDIVMISDTDDFFNSDSEMVINTIDSDTLTKWKKMGKKFMIRGDHMIYVPFYANRLCMRDHVIPDIAEKMGKYPKRNYGADEVFLKREIWPIVKKEGYFRFTTGREKISIITVLLIICVIVLFFVIKGIKKRKIKVKGENAQTK
jgi:hypothetical protein